MTDIIREPFEIDLDRYPPIPVPADIATHLVEEHGMVWDRVKLIAEFDDLVRRHQRIHSLREDGVVDGHRHA